MSQVINTNIASLNAQRNLNQSQGQLQQALERLSSGMRINGAKDDAAGLAISERFTAQINGLNQAVRNANDAISFSQTAEGALEQTGQLLQRIRELAVQSANDTNSSTDREALDGEVKQAVAEINRIAAATQFNDENVLDGTLKDLFFQVGANSGQTIVVDGVDARGSQLGALIAKSKDADEAGGVTLGNTPVSRTDGGEAALNFSGVDFTTENLTGTLTIDGRALVLDVDVDDGADSAVQMKTIADAITSAIAADAGLNAEDYEVSFNASKQTVSITNLSSENVTMVSDLRTGDGTSVTDSGGLTVATIDPADAVTVLNDLSTDPLSVGNFSFTMGGETVDLTDALSGFSGDVGELATKLNTAITQQSEFAGIQGIGDDLFSADGSNNLVFINKTLETANFSLSVTDDAGVTQTATNQTAAAGTIITTTDRVDTAGTFDISLGSTGTINITGVGEFEFSVERGSTLTTLANAIEDTIRTQAGNEDIAVTVDGTELVFTNSGFTDFVFDLNLEDGRNAALFDDTLQGAVVQDLNQYFASGQTGLFEITIEGPRNEDPVVISIPDARSLDDVVGRINRETADTGVRANVSYDGTDINFTSTLGGDFTVKIESDLGLEDEPLERTVEATTKDNSQLVDNFSVLSIDSSNDTLLAVDFALQQINGLRAQLGAVQNRLESTISNLTVGSENLSASRSRIMDADFAAETAALTRGQILQQAGTSVLAQANQLPQSVLQLLQG